MTPTLSVPTSLVASPARVTRTMDIKETASPADVSVGCGCFYAVVVAVAVGVFNVFV